MSNQGLQQQSVRTITGTSLTYEGDWLALFDAAAIPAGDFNGRLLAWINVKLSTSYTNLPQAQQALAENQGAYNFSSMGTFDASTTLEGIMGGAAEAEWIASDTVTTAVANRVETPSSGAAQADYDLTTGNALVHNSGSPDWWDFNADTTYLWRIGTNTTFLNDLHKSSGGENFTYVIVAKPALVAGGGMMGTQDTSGDSGMNMQHTSNGDFFQIQSNNDGGTNLVESDTLVAPAFSTDAIFIASYDHATSEMKLWRNNELTTLTHTKIGTATNNGGEFHIGGQNANAELPAGYKVYAAGLIQGTITNNQAASIRNYYQSLLSLTLSDTVVDAYDFVDATSVALETLSTSASVQLKGFEGTVDVVLSGGASPQFRILDIDDSTVITDWGTADSTMTAQQYIQVRDTSSDTNEITISPTVTIGGVAANYSITTVSAALHTPLGDLVSSAVFDVDATVEDSYSGSGDTFANIETTPADSESQSAYDFTRVGGTKPTFVGTAGTTSAHWTLTNGGGSFEIGANTTLVNAMHKTTGGNDWTIVFTGESLDATWGVDAIGGTEGGAGGHGIRLLAGSAENIQLGHYDGTSQILGNSSASPTLTGDIFLACAYDHTAGEVTYWLCSSTGETNAFAFNTTTTNATNKLCLGATEQTLFVLDVGQWKARAWSMFNEKLSDANIATIITEYNTRHDTTYT